MNSIFDLMKLMTISEKNVKQFIDYHIYTILNTGTYSEYMFLQNYELILDICIKEATKPFQEKISEHSEGIAGIYNNYANVTRDDAFIAFSWFLEKQLKRINTETVDHKWSLVEDITFKVEKHTEEDIYEHTWTSLWDEYWNRIYDRVKMGEYIW